MKEIIMQIITAALPVLLSYIVWLLKDQKKARSASDRGIMLLLRWQLKSWHKEYMARGYITSVELAEFLETYEAYHSLKGNGVATLWKEEVKGLDIRD